MVTTRIASLAALLVIAIVGWMISRAAAEDAPRYAVLVFSKTTGFRHDAIPSAIAVLQALGREHGFAVDPGEDPKIFTAAGLARYRAVVFLLTTGDILDADQKSAFQRYVQAGGGFVGIHSASDTEYGWPWYGHLIGAWFASHPVIQDGVVEVEDRSHPAMRELPPAWRRRDEWYNFRTNPRSEVRVLATIDEATYVGGNMGADHPIAWCREFDGGRSWYTAMGHTVESYTEPFFRLHLLGGIESAAGIARADCRPR